MGLIRRAVVAAIAVASLGLSAPAAPAAAPDPTRAGRLTSTRIEYDAGPAVLMTQPMNGAPQPVDLRGEIHLPNARGPFPVVLLMHGRHGTCTYAVVEFLGHPCPDAPPAVTPVESYAGYGYLARNLASHGYLVVSVDANGINTYDTADLDAGALARAELVSRTLDLLGEWNDGSGPGAVGTTLNGKVDLRRLGLMGHSRGGEGVTRWLAYNRARTDGPRYRLSALFSLAPTDFDDHVIDDGTPYAVLLPRCDGDVFDLQGADVFERSQYAAPRVGPLHQITVEGANHNWFNSVWTGDDFGATGDDACGTQEETTIRLTTAEQERVGLAWMAAFFRRYVGGDRAFDAMLSGRGSRAAQCSRGLKVRCGDLADLSYDPGSARRTTIATPAVQGDDLVDEPGARVDVGPALTVTPCDAWQSQPCPRQGRSDTSRSNGPQLTLDWSRPTWFGVTATQRPWRGDARGDLVVRLGVNSEQEPHTLGTGVARIRVQLTDSDGRSATVAATPSMGAPEPPPGSTVRNLLLADLRVPLRLFRGVDVTSLRRVRLLLDDPARSMQLADLALHAG